MTKRYLSVTPVPVEYVPSARLARWMRSRSGFRLLGRISAHIVWSALPSADPDVPLIFVEIADRPYLIDGHHRLERGRRLGRPEFPVVVIRDTAIVQRAMRESSAPVVYWWTWSVERRLRSWWRRRGRRSAIQLPSAPSRSA
ncbi:MAG: hypothetical protein L3J95_02530 [Thermoplasmata archaeon]|nr:hypothetical protein [Thermoplasmata archaeon]MCI4359283.1 hypothetical protein [Thermoplasmata archaeon]